MDKFTKKEFLLFLCIFILGAFLRIYHLDYPLGLHGDEAWTGIEAQRILSEGSIGVWSPGAIGQPSLPFYWTAVIFNFFGTSINNLRLSFSILEIISLPFFYLTCRLFFNRKIALISFLLYVTARIPLHFSHIAYSASNVPFFPAIFFLALSLKEKRKYYYLLAGIFLGLSPYFYPSLRILPVLFIAYFCISTFYQQNFVKELPKFIITIVAAIIVFSPLGFSYLNHPDNFFVRTNMISIFSKQGIEWAQSSNKDLSSSFSLLQHNLTSILLMFTKEGDHDRQDNIMNLPLFDPISGIFFIIGFLFQLKYLRKKEYAFLYLWFFIFLSGTLFTVDAPNFRRIQPSIAAAYIFVGFGILNVFSVLDKFLKNKRIVNLFLIFAVFLISYINIKNYFLKQGVSEETKSAFCYPLVKAADFIKTSSDPYVYFYSSRWSYNYETLRFLLNGIPGEDQSREFKSRILRQNIKNANKIYIIFPEYVDYLPQISNIYPGGQTKIHKDNNGATLFASYTLKN